MQALQGKSIQIRALEPEDLDFLYQVENDLNYWEVSSTQAPYSRFVLQQYLDNAHLDIYEAKQLRLMITEKKSGKSIGIIDLFDYSPQHKRAGIGILIVTSKQGLGYASEALKLLIDYSFGQLDLHQLFANITSDNEKSLKLFKKSGFKKVGVKKEWIYTNRQYKDEVLFQLLNT